MQLNPAPVELAAPEAISAEQFDACMARFAPFPSRAAAIAVSGGPDSMALAYLARGWATKHGIRLMAFIVDHKLRPESSEEAEKVQVRLSQLGIISEVLSWQHEAVVSKLHATARKARYRLLLAACRRHKIGDLLLAHQQDDQAETVLMRFAKGSGVDGLAGIPAENKSNGVRLLRPLLSFSKDNLVATCIEQIIPYVLDPSNRSEKFARGRLRRVMPLLEQEGFTIERLADLASRARDAKDALDHFTSLLLRVAGKQDNAGIVRLSLEQLRSSPRAIALRAVASCLQNIHAEEYAPEQISLASLTDALRTDGEMAARTLHGCLVTKTGRDAIFMREPSAASIEVPIQPGETVIWDGRWQITLAAGLEGMFTIRSLGNPPHDELDRVAPELRRMVPQGRARASLPTIWQGDKIAFVPEFKGSNANAPALARLLSSWPPQGTHD